MSDARATPWQPDPLLARTPARAPSFVRMPWDEGNAQAFGPWRMQDNMFTFENLAGVDNRGIQTLMRAVEPDLLMIALKGAPDFVKDKFFDNMSSRARVMFIDDMEAKGPLRLTEVEDAQKKVMRLARKLSDAGELVLAGSGDDFV